MATCTLYIKYVYVIYILLSPWALWNQKNPLQPVTGTRED